MYSTKVPPGVEPRSARKVQRSFGPRVGLQNGPTTDDLLALGERPIGHLDSAVGEAHANAILARQEAAGIDENAFLERFLHEPTHGLHQGGRRRRLAIRLGMADE